MRAIRFIHKWTGLVIGLFFLFSCLTGMIIVFGKIIGSYAPVFKWAKQAHTTLFMGDTGERIIEIATVGALCEILTGYILWANRTLALTRVFKKNQRSPWGAIKRNLGFSFPNWLSGLHSGGGFWSGLPLLIMVLTSLIWCFGWGGSMFHEIHGLHVGSWGGICSRIVWFVAVIIGASLPVTGFLLYVRRIYKQRKSRKEA